MTFTMFDSINVANLPDGSQYIGAYVDGRWPTILDARARFPKATILSIAVFPEDDAECLDVETGDATLASVYDWFLRQQHRKAWRPVIYTSASNLASLLATMTANGLHRSSYRIWAAHYTYAPHVCGPSACGYPQADATQWRDDAPGLHASLVDESLLTDAFFPAPPKPPPPPPKPSAVSLLQGDDMLIPAGETATVAVPVPLGVPLPGGAWGVPSVVRLSSASPGSFQVAFGTAEPAAWQQAAFDYGRSPQPFPLPLDVNGDPVAVLKLQPPPGGNPAPVTVDFA